MNTIDNTLTIKALQSMILDMYHKRGHIAGPSTLALGVAEEAGEIAQAVLLTQCSDFKPSAKKMSIAWSDVRDVASEAGDCITYILALCNSLGIEPTFKWMNR